MNLDLKQIRRKKYIHKNDAVKKRIQKMTRQELQDFIDKNNESTRLEYKLKPNFSNIKKVMEHISKRMEWMHFNILKTIYAFANTKGGDLYIGIGEYEYEDKDESKKKKKQTIVGVDAGDLSLIESVLNKKSPKITIIKKTIPLTEEKRDVIKITVKELERYDKPQLLDGVLYVRRDDESHPIQSFEDQLKIYKKEQFYLFLLKGLEANLHGIKDTSNNFMVKQFIDGLKHHIRQFANQNKITNPEIMNEAENLLNKIQKRIIKSKSLKTKSPIEAPDNVGQKKSIDESINDFMKTYKAIIKLGV